MTPRDVDPMIDDPGGMCGTAAFARWKNALMLVASVRSHPSSGMPSMEFLVIWNAALFSSTPAPSRAKAITTARPIPLSAP